MRLEQNQHRNPTGGERTAAEMLPCRSEVCVHLIKRERERERERERGGGEGGGGGGGGGTGWRRIVKWLEWRTRDRKVAGSSPGRRAGRIFFSRSTFCADSYFGIRSDPVLQQ